MKILVVHNFHRKGSASGDDQVFKSETALLEKHGNTVVRYSVENDRFDAAGILGKIRYTLGMLWSFRYYRELKSEIKRAKPDLVHIHTFFPLLSPSVLYAAKRCGVPVVATLHDTRFICPCATSLREGRLCNECIDGHYLRMWRYGCFKGSRIQSLFVALVFTYHRLRRSFFRKIDRYICLNEEQIALLKESGYDPEKISKKYNFVSDPLREGQLQNSGETMSVPSNRGSSSLQEQSRDLPERFVVFYGRIGEEKGIRQLMQIFSRLPKILLVVMGTGPMDREFNAWVSEHDNVSYLGYVPREKCLQIVKKSEFVVFPSIWYEGCSMVEIEAESLGKCLIATDLGFSKELIRDDENGYKVPLGDTEGFAERIRMLFAEPETSKLLGENARRDYEKRFTPEENYKELMEIYGKLVK